MVPITIGPDLWKKYVIVPPCVGGYYTTPGGNTVVVTRIYDYHLQKFVIVRPVLPENQLGPEYTSPINDFMYSATPQRKKNEPS